MLGDMSPMDSFVAVLGVVSGIAGILALFLPAHGWRQRATHVIYGLFIAVLATLAFNYQSKIAARTAMENQAAALLKTADLRNSASSRGFILASLSFLEKHKDRLPDTYNRAVKLSENSGVLVNRQDDGMARLYQGWSMEETAGAMKQLLSGIAAGQVDAK